MDPTNLPAAIEAARHGLTQLALETLGVADTVAFAFGLPLPDHHPDRADGLIPSAVAYLGSALKTVAATCRAAGDRLRPMTDRWRPADDPPFVPGPPVAGDTADVMAGRAANWGASEYDADHGEPDDGADLPTYEEIQADLAEANAAKEEAERQAAIDAERDALKAAMDGLTVEDLDAVCRPLVDAADPPTVVVEPDGDRFRVVEAIPATCPPAILADGFPAGLVVGKDGLLVEPPGKKPRPKSRKKPKAKKGRR